MGHSDEVLLIYGIKLDDEIFGIIENLTKKKFKQTNVGADLITQWFRKQRKISTFPKLSTSLHFFGKGNRALNGMDSYNIIGIPVASADAWSYGFENLDRAYRESIRYEKGIHFSVGITHDDISDWKDSFKIVAKRLSGISGRRQKEFSVEFIIHSTWN